jgi:hypothetical protein
VAALPEDWLSDWIGRGLRTLACLCMASIVIALAAPYRAEMRVEQFAPGAEIVLLLDRSRSMDQPFAADARSSWFGGRSEAKAAVAQRLLSQFAARRTHDRIGMVVFSTLPIPIIGLTRNGDLAQAAIRASSLGRGLAETDLGRGLIEALSYFEGRPYAGSRVILLVSDGGAELDANTRARIAWLMKRDHVTLDWLYLRSFHSPGLGGAAPEAGTAAGARAMELIERRRRVLAAMAAMLGAIALFALGTLLRIDYWNALMTRPAIVAAPEDAPTDVRLAQAWALAARGKFWAALSLYRQIIASGDPTSRTTARFNEGNLLLREAIALLSAGDDARAQPLLQLAKESYRQVLREQPLAWDAKYNLELALRWAPELEEEQGEVSSPIVVRRAAVIERGVVQGLP